VKIPYDHLNNSSYQICSTRVIDERSYGGILGKTINSGPYGFKGSASETILCFSDWHEKPAGMITVASGFPQPDLVILLGDGSDLNFDRDIIDFIIRPGAAVTRSECPAIFVRGNHDCRGRAAHGLAAKLGLNSLYYQCARNGVLFTVLETGEDKGDDNWEYAGFAKFEQYCEKQGVWLEGLASEGAKFRAVDFQLRICLAHCPNLREFDETEKQKWMTALAEMGTDLLVAGHTHGLLVEERGERPFPLICEGGRSGESFTGGCLSLSGRDYRFVGQDNAGRTVLAVDGRL
jgi:predicted phosphodiesterase